MQDPVVSVKRQRMPQWPQTRCIARCGQLRHSVCRIRRCGVERGSKTGGLGQLAMHFLPKKCCRGLRSRQQESAEYTYDLNKETRGVRIKCVCMRGIYMYVSMCVFVCVHVCVCVCIYVCLYRSFIYLFLYFIAWSSAGLFYLFIFIYFFFIFFF